MVGGLTRRYYGWSLSCFKLRGLHELVDSANDMSILGWLRGKILDRVHLDFDI